MPTQGRSGAHFSSQDTSRIYLHGQNPSGSGALQAFQQMGAAIGVALA